MVNQFFLQAFTLEERHNVSYLNKKICCTRNLYIVSDNDLLITQIKSHSKVYQSFDRLSSDRFRTPFIDMLLKSFNQSLEL